MSSFISFLNMAIKFSTVFLFGATGEIINQKSGHLNMGTPGIMYLGALGGILGERIYLNSVPAGQPLNGFAIVFIPILFAILFGALGGVLFSFFTVTLHCNQNVTGLTLTTFGVGLSCFFIQTINTDRMAEAGLQLQKAFVGYEDVADIIIAICLMLIGLYLLTKVLISLFAYKNKNGFINRIIVSSVLIICGALFLILHFVVGAWFDEIFLSQSWFTYLGIIVAVCAAIVIKYTRVGLNLRAVGENASAADSAGINVNAYRYIATIIGGAIAGIGGAFYELDNVKGMFNVADGIDAFGWLALCIVIFSFWKPSLAIATSFLFACLSIAPTFFAPYLRGANYVSYILKMVPYIATIVVLVVVSAFNRKKTQPPANLGVSYFREDR